MPKSAMRAEIVDDEARELVTTFTAEVGLTGILKAFGDGHCAVYSLRGV